MDANANIEFLIYWQWNSNLNQNQSTTLTRNQTINSYRQRFAHVDSRDGIIFKVHFLCWFVVTRKNFGSYFHQFDGRLIDECARHQTKNPEFFVKVIAAIEWHCWKYSRKQYDRLVEWPISLSVDFPYTEKNRRDQLKPTILSATQSNRLQHLIESDSLFLEQVHSSFVKP